MFSLFVSSAFGHADMVNPPTWFQPNGSDALEPYNLCGGQEACLWFTNYTFSEKTVMAADSPMRTYAYSDPTFEIFSKNPWAYPGSAKVNSPCGTFGGNPEGCGELPAGEACYGGGFGYGPDARVAYKKTTEQLYGSFPAFNGFPINLEEILTTKVEAGGVLDANFVIQANHGGGYAYRLCPVPEDGDMTKLTEECFQDGHLDFASDYSWIQWGANKEDSLKFKATRSNNGTYPESSTWTRNPIPACGSPDGGVFTEGGNACENAGGITQFEPVVPGIQGFGTYYAGSFEEPVNSDSFSFSVGDALQIPRNLEPGKYVLSWRWDCEQTSQVWFTCSDLEVTAPQQKPLRPAPRKHFYNPHNGPRRGPKRAQFE